MPSQRVRIIEGGKLIIPASLRRQLRTSTGDTVLVDVADGEFQVRSLSKVIAHAQAILQRHVPIAASRL